MTAGGERPPATTPDATTPAGVGASAYELSNPVRTWVTTGPAVVTRAARKLRILARPVDQVTKAADQVARAATAAGADGPAATSVVVQGPSLRTRLFGTSAVLLSGIFEMLLLLYALLAVGDLFLEKLVDALPRRGDREKAIHIARTMESAISTFLLLTAVINVGEGAVVVGAMALLGMPTPFLWGALVAAAEFIPYVGMIGMVAILTVVSLTTFDSVTRALLVPAVYVVINLIQGNVVTPLVMSRRLTLNLVVIFLALALGWWMWGIAGVFLAVPLLAVLKIFCDHIESLASVGAFLGDRDMNDRRSLVRARLVSLAMRPPAHG
jgi:predicted PurR-regulated permease PerM